MKLSLNTYVLGHALTQIEALKSIRKPATPPTKVIRPLKGGGYRRPRNTKWDNE